MQMKVCFICNTPITDANASDEHIILNSLGGRLHSRKLLCKNCNSRLGQKSDAKLSEMLKFAATQLDVKRQRGENQVIHTADEEVYDLAPGCKPVLKKPVVKVEEKDDGSIRVEMKVRSMQEARSQLKALKKKYPFIDIEKIMSSAKTEKKFIGKPILVPVEFNGRQVFPSIMKTALEFYLERDGERAHIVHLIPYLLEQKEVDFCWYYYPEQPVVTVAEDEICHILCVKGDAKEGILYGYVDLFGILQCLVLLNDHYTGADFSESYIYEVIQMKEFSRQISLSLSRSDILKLVSGNEAFWVDGLIRQMKLFQKKAGEINRNRITDVMWERALENSLKQYPEDILITEEMIKELLKELEKELIPWYVSRICWEDEI